MLGENLIRLVGATLVLVIGWFVARAVAGGVLGALERFDLDARVGRWLMWEDGKPPPNVDQYVATGIPVMLIAFGVGGRDLAAEMLHEMKAGRKTASPRRGKKKTP